MTYRWYASADGGESWTVTWLDGYDTNTLSFIVNASRAAKLYKCIVTDVADNTVETNCVSLTIG